MNTMLGNSTSRWRLTVLGAWTVGVALLLVFGKYSLFIRARLWPLLLGTLVILLLFLLSMAVRPAAGSRLKLSAWLRGAILLVPLIYLATLVTGTAASGLNSYALQKRVVDFSAGPDSLLTDSGTTPAAPAVAGQVTNLGYLVKHLSQLSGSHVLVEGRISRDPAATDGRVYLFRFIVVCCAADAIPIEVQIESPDLSQWHDDQWVRVGGILRTETHDGGRFPIIAADSIQAIDAPAEPYLSPSSIW